MNLANERTNIEAGNNLLILKNVRNFNFTPDKIDLKNIPRLGYCLDKKSFVYLKKFL